MAQENKFVYTPSKAATVGIHGPRDLPKLMKKAILLARVPISKFKVGVVGLTSKCKVFLGVNVEFEGVPLHHSIHGEQFLVTNLALNSVEEELTHIAVSNDGTKFGAPCGHCRQFYQELGTLPKVKILIQKPDEGKDEYMSIESLMPESFGPEYLLPKDYPLLLAHRDNKLVLLDTEEICSDSEKCPHLKCRALAAANKSYAPYSKSTSGVALKCDDKVYRGWYLESAAYNPSLGPVQAALVDFVARSGGKEFEDITEAVLVEKHDATTVIQEDTTRIFLKKIAPNCDFKVLRCKKP
ncbi:PREDICTED: cytidine deaminase 6-like [Camelina sativa]|uniref:cytidine deaminase n=1 Tax=Camelina sativa TaxID=90675 RepID=A0ABM0V5K8_CAMSA|nr:PREDICTED: cytidine deaminase 6-like [Camelina sativa]